MSKWRLPCLCNSKINDNRILKWNCLCVELHVCTLQSTLTADSPKTHLCPPSCLFNCVWSSRQSICCVCSTLQNSPQISTVAFITLFFWLFGCMRVFISSLQVYKPVSLSTGRHVRLPTLWLLRSQWDVPALRGNFWDCLYRLDLWWVCWLGYLGMHGPLH